MKYYRYLDYKVDKYSFMPELDTLNNLENELDNWPYALEFDWLDILRDNIINAIL